ncbi:HD domain-containing protein [Cellulophaga sp. E16_2]|uniref:Metal-dependent phosphohydrolase HD sub domain protein n=1 Tax=Cellulophaga algicola (strain DSM 14237 / IC166 / ACAM 630) TaxID=688270 RepID=E6X504_CELAD|nr:MULTISPECIES: Pycsar system effector family protein [Cellulophaga]ADV48315.1 metal-dependent phosphohydrolase HD sub domain protein [Cellulophaga algicola DSM 14237]MBO0590736.1 HD domain-containing protein [Cellulophaga sp. E16_2]
MNDILSKTEEHATELLTKKLDSSYLYHNLRHTQRVVKSTKELLNFYSLKEEENNAITIAAWLHDIGYTVSATDHEEHGAKLAKAFLENLNCEQGLITTVCRLILATKMGHDPKDICEEIIKDADCSHFAQSSYVETSELLRDELAQLNIATLTRKEWRNKNIELFRTQHHYYTEYAKENWQPKKDENLEDLLKKKKKNSKLVKKEELKVSLKNKSPERGIQTMFRVTMRNHLKLSDIADTKANILLSVNAIIISLILANLIPKLDNPTNDYLVIPAAIFVIFSVASMIMSVLATRPNVTSGEFTKEDVENKKVNLLFFGNFHKMKLEEYEWAIQELIKDQVYVYSSLTKDLYFLGLVLDKKYKLLRWTYTIFMIGMVLSVIAFFVALKFYGPERIIELPT